MSTTTFTPATTMLRADSTSGTTRALVAAGAAVTGNTLVWALGRIGEPIRVVIGTEGESEPLAWSHVAITTVIATVLGGVVLAAMRRRGMRDRLWATAALTVAVVSAVPLWRLDINANSKTLLTVMHLFTGLCCVIAHLARRQQLGRERVSVAAD
jgi:Family of unknown function (DUF6069)